MTVSSIVFIGAPEDVADADDVVVRVPVQISTKEALFAYLTAHLRFPDYFGRNWDAFEECLNNLSWFGSQRVILFHERVPAMPQDDKRMYLEILSEVGHAVSGVARLLPAFSTLVASEVEQLLSGPVEGKQNGSH